VRRSTGSRRASNRSTHWLAALLALLVGGATLLFARPASGVLSLLDLAAAGLVGLAAEAAIWLRPPRGAWTRLLYSGWALPALLLLAARLALGQPPFGTEPLRAPATLAALALLALALLLQNAEAAGAGGNLLVRYGVTLLAYLVAFALFTLIYQAKSPPLLSGLLCSVSAGLLALVVLREHGATRAATRAYALVVALALGQAGVALGFWSSPALVGGALLLLLFYVLVGLAEALLDRALDRRVVLEYGIVAAVGMALVLSTAPWRA